MEDINQYEKVDTYRSYKYAIWFHDYQGYRCGYVQIPENHPFYEQNFTEIDLNSIGLSFSGHIKGLDGWFIGWDHHHLWDAIDEDGIRKIHGDDPEIEKIIEYAKSMSGDEYGFPSTTDDVENECHMVIEELIRLERRNNND